MGKVTHSTAHSQRRIDFVLKRKIDEISEVEEDPMAAASDHLPLLELEQQQPHSHCNEHSNEHVIFRGIEFLQRDHRLRPQMRNKMEHFLV